MLDLTEVVTKSGVQGKLSKKQRKQLKAENAEAAKELALAKRQAKKAKVGLRVCDWRIELT